MTQSDLIQEVLRLLAGLGVRECCVAAGARNAPVIAALLASRNVEVRHFFEERSAAFFALGRVMDTRRPVVVLTTSGTAAAELLPAVIEAHYQALPLIALTADRPRHYRGSGAPQSIEQPALFGPYVSAVLDIDAANVEQAADLLRSASATGPVAPHSVGRAAGSPVPPGATEPVAPRLPLDRPLHLNLCLDEPLATGIPGIDFAKVEQAAGLLRSASATEPVAPRLAAFSQTPRPAVLAAGLTPADAARIKPLLLALHAPVLAEATSNLWSAPIFDAALAPLLLAATDDVFHTLNPSHLLRLGSVPTLRAWRDLEDLPGIPVLHFSRAPFPGLARQENSILHPWNALPSSAPACAAPLPPAVPPPVFSHHPNSEPALLQSLSLQFTPGSRVFLGNSLPIREMNQVIASQPPGVVFHANRGANGIDGLVSTWLGLDAGPGGDSWIILGDLSALYDLAAPWILPQLAPRRRFLVVINNGGGRIFSRVPGLRALPDAARTLIENRHALSFRPFAELWNMTHTLITEAGRQLATLQDLPTGTHCIEIRPGTAEYI